MKKSPEVIMKSIMETLYGTTDENVARARANRIDRQNKKRSRKLREIFKVRKGMANRT